jgi:hypothetical protein
LVTRRRAGRAPGPRSAGRRAGPPSGRPPGCWKIGAGQAAGSGPCFGERGVPFRRGCPCICTESIAVRAAGAP